MQKRKLVEKPALELPTVEGDAETLKQIAQRLEVSSKTALTIIHHYDDLGQLRHAAIPGIDIAGRRCRNVVYWIEGK